MPTLRLKLDPLPFAAPGTSGVSGFRLGLVRRGPGTTLAKRDSPQAARITFRARFLPRPSSDAAPREESLGTLSGDLSLDPDRGTPRFVLPSDETHGLRSVSEDDESRPLRLELDPNGFEGAENAPPFILRLPTILGDDFSHVEIDVALSIGGSDEAPFGANDTLDVPLSPRPEFVLQLVDEIGVALAGVRLEFSVLGVPFERETDDQGFVRIDDLAADGAAIRFLDADALLAVLGDRWNSARVGSYVHPAQGVLVVPVSQLKDAVFVQSEPRLRLSIQPRVVQARITGSMYDTDKSFVLPAVIPSLRELARLYEGNPQSKLLLVGHTDTSGSTHYNDSLSLERAESLAAFLRDDVDTWLGRYAKSVEAKRRWGPTEDLQMLSGLTPGIVPAVLDGSAVLAFQQAHNQLPPDRQSKSFAVLPENGELDDATRRQLIGDYMNQDETSLPEEVEVTIHGCGEFFPLISDGTELDSNAADSQRDPVDRRVELFFFERDFGIRPRPPARNSQKGSREYPEWRRRARETHEFDVNASGKLTISTFAPADSNFKFFVDQEDGSLLAALTREQGRVQDDIASFDFVPELLPTSVQFRVERDGRVDQLSGVVNPVVLRDALFRGDLDRASTQVTRGTQSPAATPSAANLAPDSTATVDLNTLPLVFAFHWANANHRFLRSMKFSLRALSGSASGRPLPEAKGSKLGFKKLFVPDDVGSVRLEIDITSNLSGVTILALQQEFQILRVEGRAPSIAAKKSNIAGLFQHPRVQSLAYDSGDPGNVVIAVELDLLFLDVTEHLRNLPNLTGNVAVFDSIRADGAANIQCEYRVLEHTGGRPSAWVAVLPPALSPNDADTNVLLFFRNEILNHFVGGTNRDGAYTTPEDVPLAGALSTYWRSSTFNANYLVGQQGFGYENYPKFGWDRQLRASQKPVVVLFPLPHSTDLGVLDSPGASSKALIESSLLALFAERHLATGQSFAPRLRRLAVGGWSSGVATLFHWALARADLTFVDELYVFDGLKGYPVDLEQWFKVDPGRRRLRLIGTAYTETSANQIKQRLTHPNVFVEPGDPRYWYTNQDYLAALRQPGQRISFRFRSSPAEPLLPADASRSTALFVKSESLKGDQISVQSAITFFAFVLPDNAAAGSKPRLVTRTINNIGHEEAALFALTDEQDQFGFGLGPVERDADFKRSLDRLDRQPLRPNGTTNPEPVKSFRHRHPWSVFGGVFDDPSRPFVGYFQLCLERSGF